MPAISWASVKNVAAQAELELFAEILYRNRVEMRDRILMSRRAEAVTRSAFQDGLAKYSEAIRQANSTAHLGTAGSLAQPNRIWTSALGTPWITWQVCGQTSTLVGALGLS